jgi:anti-sigma B factor antagonist
MTAMEVRVSSRNGAAWVELKGEFDLGSAAEVEQRLSDVERGGPSTVVLDLRELSFIDSTGLRTVLAADARARREGRRLMVIPGPPLVHRVFRIALLDQRLEFVEETALAEGTGHGGD